MRYHNIRMQCHVFNEIEFCATCHFLFEIPIAHDFTCINFVRFLAAALFDKTGTTLIANQLELLISGVEIVQVVVELEDGSAANLERTALGLQAL